MSDQPQLKAVENQGAAYNDLKYYFSNLNSLFSIRNTLAVDMMTAMPGGALNRRLHDIAAITKRMYAETTTQTVTRLLDQVENEAAQNPDKWDFWNLNNLREMRRIHSHLSALPSDLYLALVQISSEGRKRQHLAMSGGKWADIKPYMAHVIDLSRRSAELKQEKFNVPSPYQAMLLGYASDISEDDINRLYDSLLVPLKDLMGRAIERQNSRRKPMPLIGPYPQDDQMWLNKSMLDLMGFDFGRGNLQVASVSPMAAGSSEDARILVRCSNTHNFLESLEDTLYQGARGLYYQNLPQEWARQPVGQDLGAFMMNTLSNLYQTIIGRTPQFFEFVSQRAVNVFRNFQSPALDPENLYLLRKTITLSPQRNEADDLSKIFHDVMRYRIERDLINGALSIDDLPERWAADMKEYLGFTPAREIDGPLQNPDWFTGRFGFIPTNTLAHIAAATLHEKMYHEMGNLSERVESGDLRSINLWLKDKIHSKGRSVDTFELLHSITGEKLSAQPLLRHLERRYLSEKS